MAVSKVLKEVLGSLKPQGPSKEITATLKKVNDLIEGANLKAKAVIGGSYAKGTNLPGDHDVDIFVKFSMAYVEQDLSALLGKVMIPFKPLRVHGSRDYFQLKQAGVSYEFIPVLDIKSTNQVQNVTDCSTLHTSWFLKKGKGLQDQVRLAKLFCKAQGVYGAESHIRGFSGHVLDILIVYYGGFEKLLKAVQKWKVKTVIDQGNVHKGKALFNLNKSKTLGPLVVIDPIQRDRNASSGVSEEKFHRLIDAAKAFSKKPSSAFFVPEELDLDILKKKFPALLIVKLKPHEGKDDVVGSKVLKVFEELRASLKDFSPIESGWEFEDPSILWYGLARTRRDSEILISGPPIDIVQHAEAFKKAHKGAFVKDGRLFAKEKRELIDALDVAKVALKHPHLKEKMVSHIVELRK
ncbi:MAG TPA: nucleotidyltransferase domain-containing protein [Candidatus Nanoarchaeia archaeon]|nr:nucleotidyltransferase domain-containing protein [Candidatus Nanoarchaeia archaeon]